MGLNTLSNVKFKYNTPLPRAIQDFFGGIIHGHIIISCGCAGTALPKGRGLRSLSNLTYAVNVEQLLEQFNNPDLEETTVPCKGIAKFPGLGRQKGSCAVYDDILFCWGGLQYRPTKVLNKEVLKKKKKNTKSFMDGYALMRIDQKWIWKKLPDLPYFMCGASLTVIDDHFYLFGGADYYDSIYNTCNDRNGETDRIGARLYRISALKLKKHLLGEDELVPSWEELPQCKNEAEGIGSPRMNHIGVGVNGKLYVLGGVSGRPFGGRFFSIIDNWCYDPKTNQWTRILDCPSTNTNWQSTTIYKNRYILLVGGAHTWNIRKENKPRTYLDRDEKEHPGFGELRTNKIPGHKGLMSGDMIAYDTETNAFVKFDGINGSIPLPMDINNPLVLSLTDDIIVAIGGEIEIDRKKCSKLATILNTYLSNSFMIGRFQNKL